LRRMVIPVAVWAAITVGGPKPEPEQAWS